MRVLLALLLMTGSACAQMDAGRLRAALLVVCPVVGDVKVGDSNDRTTWTYEPGACNAAQITAANNVVATISLVKLNVVQFGVFIARWSDAEYTALMRARASAISAGNVTLVKQWDIASSLGVVDLNTPAAQAFKTAIVAAGILTQQRADIIFQ